jgi:hypothetical protein
MFAQIDRPDPANPELMVRPQMFVQELDYGGGVVIAYQGRNTPWHPLTWRSYEWHLAVQGVPPRPSRDVREVTTLKVRGGVEAIAWSAPRPFHDDQDHRVLTWLEQAVGLRVVLTSPELTYEQLKEVAGMLVPVPGPRQRH